MSQNGKPSQTGQPENGEAQEALKEHRKQIDQIDRQVMGLLNQRAGHALSIAQAKKAGEMHVYSPQREQEVIKSLTSANQGPLPSPALAKIYTEIISACRGLQGKLRVAYLGPEFTFSHQAALRQFGNSSELAPQTTIVDVFEEVSRGRSQVGVVPVENSSEGAVNLTLDLLMETDLMVCGEILWPVSHALMAKDGGMDQIKRVYSHPQALNQCRKWLARNLPGAALLASASTAAACQRAAGESDAAAVGGEVAARAYNLKVLAREIQDVAFNATRFFVLGKDDCPITGEDKTSFVFVASHKPGSLYRALKHLSDQGINLTRIESRPTKNKLWEYAFFVDFLGHRKEPGVRSALSNMEGDVAWLRVLGSYPVGDNHIAD